MVDKRVDFSFKLNSLKETAALGDSIGKRLKGGEIIELISDLGGGKTTLVKAIVSGSGSGDQVTSPSFTIRNDYKSGNLSIAHFDFYRLDDPGILRDMLAEAMLDLSGSVLIEWAGIVDDILPADHIRIELIVTGPDSRFIKVSTPEKFAYLFKEVK